MKTDVLLSAFDTWFERGVPVETADTTDWKPRERLSSVEEGIRILCRDAFLAGHKAAKKVPQNEPMAKAYLIVICDPETNAIRQATIWSSPEWEQSLSLPDAVVYVAYILPASSYDEARKRLVELLHLPGFRYHWLEEYLNKKD